MSDTKITIEATISADTQKVWSYWTQPAHITKWNFASDDWQCPWATNDLRKGGKYSARMEAKDGSFGFEFSAIYDEVIEYEKMTYTIGDGREVTTEFKAEGDKTKVTTVFDAENQNPIEMQRGGWQSILDNFKSYVESN
ncbi:MAG: activator of HSP90 ATPase [Gammaproteobacteria bacterium]|nr:MAG: activator of HSP90 ATPase [Gammaproteobacteria bacterium]